MAAKGIDDVLAGLAGSAPGESSSRPPRPRKTSLRGYAQVRGVTPAAVQLALNEGRLTSRSSTKSAAGRWTIDVEEADREWEADTQAPKAPPGTVSVQAFARLVGVTPMAVRQAIDEGRIGPEAYTRLPNRRTLIDPVIAEQHWRERTDPMRSKIGPAAGPEGPPVPGSFTRSRLPVDSDGRALTLPEIRAIREAGMVEIERVKLAEMQALLVRTREVAQRWREKCRIARDRILAVPAREANALAATTDPVAHEIAHERALREALTALADELGAPE